MLGIYTKKVVKALDEEALVKAIVSGQTDRFEELVESYKDKVFNMACRFTGNTQEGQDLAQEIFLLIYRNLKSFQGQSSLSTWIYRVSLNRCLDWQRKHRRRRSFLFQPLLPANEDWDILDHIPSSQATPEETALKKEENLLLHQAIHQLPDKYQKVIVLHHFENLSYQKIADILDLPVRTVETQLYRGKKKLKDIIVKKQKEKAEVKDYGFA